MRLANRYAASATRGWAVRKGKASAMSRRVPVIKPAVLARSRIRARGSASAAGLLALHIYLCEGQPPAFRTTDCSAAWKSRWLPVHQRRPGADPLPDNLVERGQIEGFGVLVSAHRTSGEGQVGAARSRCPERGILALDLVQRLGQHAAIDPQARAGVLRSKKSALVRSRTGMVLHEVSRGVGPEARKDPRRGPGVGDAVRLGFADTGCRPAIENRPRN